MKLNSFNTTFQGLFTNKPKINKRHSKHSHPKTASLFLFTDFTDILLNVNVALIDVVSLVVNVFNKNNNNNNLLTNAAKCQIVSPVL